MALRPGTKFTLSGFVADPVWLCGEYQSDLKKTESSVQAVVASPLLEWLLEFLTRVNFAEVKPITHRWGAGVCIRGGQ